MGPRASYRERLADYLGAPERCRGAKKMGGLATGGLGRNCLPPEPTAAEAGRRWSWNEAGVEADGGRDVRTATHGTVEEGAPRSGVVMVEAH